MVWIWKNPDEDRVQIWVDYDDRCSGLDGSEALDGKRLPPDSGNAIFRTEEFGSSEVRSLDCLPTTGNTPVINEELRKIVARLAGPDEVQFYPVSVDTVDGRVEGYSFVIPLNRIRCTDVQKSVITAWIIPGKHAYGYRSLRFLPNCLNDLAIARDDVTNVVVVSDALRGRPCRDKRQGAGIHMAGGDAFVTLDWATELIHRRGNRFRILSGAPPGNRRSRLEPSGHDHGYGPTKFGMTVNRSFAPRFKAQSEVFMMEFLLQARQ